MGRQNHKAINPIHPVAPSPPRPLSLVYLGLAAAVWLIASSPAFAQFQGNVGGISIDPEGVLTETKALSQDDRLKLIQEEAVKGPANAELAAPAPLRKVSLKRWEQQVEELHRAGESLPPDVAHLAGLTRIQYVIFDPAKKDVILIGPAEGWKQLPTGEVVGTKSGRPVLHADDLIAALRYAFSDNKNSIIGCSIDPTPEGLKRYTAYLNTLGRIDRSRVKQIFAGMEQAMGPQAVRFFGVEPTSRFALAMLAADYRLKRIALGHDPSPVKDVSNYLDLTAENFKTGPQKQHRWWFEAKYDAIRTSPDDSAFEFVGQGVDVVTAPSHAGAQAANQMASPAAEEFADAFTKHFTAIAEKQPVFLELQNLIALAVTAELIAEKQRVEKRAATSGSETPLLQRVEKRAATSGSETPLVPVAAQPGHWKPEHLLNADACRIREYHVPKQAPSLANYRLIRNRHWLISISGGVEISPEDLIRQENRDAGPHRGLQDIAEQSRGSGDSNSFWWDGKE